MTEIDLRTLPPPQPMLEILRRIDDGAAAPFLVRLPHVPIPLLPELDARGWGYGVVALDEAGCVLRLSPPGGA